MWNKSISKPLEAMGKVYGSRNLFFLFMFYYFLEKNLKAFFKNPLFLIRKNNRFKKTSTKNLVQFVQTMLISAHVERVGVSRIRDFFVFYTYKLPVVPFWLKDDTAAELV